MKKNFLKLFAAVAVLTCAGDENFQKLGNKIASPVDVAASADGKHFYVLNTDFDRTYNRGSIVILDDAGNKKEAVIVPRLGRTLTIAGEYMLATFDRSTVGDDRKVRLYSVKDARNPVLKKEWEISCRPLNTVMRADYPYFFVSCTNGMLYLGDREDLSLRKVRHYDYARRALHLDVANELLLSFPTVLGKEKGTISDVKMTDRFTVDDVGNEIDEPNGIPDEWETAGNERKGKHRGLYKFAVYDIATEKRDYNFAFPADDRDLSMELRWIYFPLQAGGDTEEKFYRTNFWDAHPDPEDASVFYLSHRGNPDSEANNIIKVKIKGEERESEESDEPPLTNEMLEFETVYASADDADLKFPGDIEVASVNGVKTLLVNNFRDFVNWRSDQVFFAITALTLSTDSAWKKSFSAQTMAKSYYRFAANDAGTVVVSSFYGNRVFIFKLQPEKTFRKFATIE